MAKCVHCGQETTLYINETPICVSCDDESERNPPRKPVQSKREHDSTVKTNRIGSN